LGSVLGWYDTGRLSLPRMLLAALGAVLVHAGTNLLNEYADHVSGADEANVSPTPFSGGSRVIQDGLIAPRSILLASAVAFASGAGIGLYLNDAVRGNAVLALGVAGVLLGCLYSARPVRIGYLGFGLGEISVGIGFGPLMVLGAYYVQAEAFSLNALLLSLPVAALIMMVLIINGFPDRESDLSVGKRTLVGVLGRRLALRVYLALMAGAFALVAVLATLDVAPPACLIVFASAPLAWKASSVSWRHFEDPEKLMPANAATIGLHAAAGLLLSAGFVLDRAL
jgi:1,4-dihydroxy-2-naphthoate octaprenyltransferase